MRLVFMGTPGFAVPSLEVLLEHPGELVAVYTQPDRPSGRGLEVAISPVKERARAAGVEVRQPATLRDDGVFAELAELRPDLCVVAAYGKILPARYLEAPRLGCVNVHASLLPRYRGAAPIQWAIVRGETETGITLLQMDAGMDTGDILLQRAIPIDPEDTAGSLEAKLSHLGAEVLREGLARLRQGPLPRTPQDPAKATMAPGRLGPLPRTPQDPAKATMAPLLRKEDGRVDWTRRSTEIHDLVRGMNPWPGAWTHHRGRLLKIFRTAPVPLERAAAPGTIVRALRAGGGRLEVACGEGALALLELQAEGRKRLPVGEFLAGYRLAEGDVLS